MSRCWAYNVEGNRCEQDAGHDGHHEIKKMWSDEECFSPLQFQTPSKPEIKPAPAPEKDKVVRCVACSHSHRGGECKCGCHEFIG